MDRTPILAGFSVWPVVAGVGALGAPTVALPARRRRRAIRTVVEVRPGPTIHPIAATTLLPARGRWAAGTTIVIATESRPRKAATLGGSTASHAFGERRWRTESAAAAGTRRRALESSETLRTAPHRRPTEAGPIAPISVRSAEAAFAAEVGPVVIPIIAAESISAAGPHPIISWRRTVIAPTSATIEAAGRTIEPITARSTEAAQPSESWPFVIAAVIAEFLIATAARPHPIISWGRSIGPIAARFAQAAPALGAGPLAVHIVRTLIVAAAGGALIFAAGRPGVVITDVAAGRGAIVIPIGPRLTLIRALIAGIVPGARGPLGLAGLVLSAIGTRAFGLGAGRGDRGRYSRKGEQNSGGSHR